MDKVSKNKAVAQSKKTNLLKALVAGRKTEAQVRTVLAVDTVLADYWKTVDEDIERALAGLRPSDRAVERKDRDERRWAAAQRAFEATLAEGLEPTEAFEAARSAHEAWRD